MFQMTIRALFLFSVVLAFTAQAAEHKQLPPGEPELQLRTRYHSEPGGEPKTDGEAQQSEPAVKATVKTKQH